MQIFTQISQLSTLNIASHSPIALTLGTFDGVHRGHHALFSSLKEVATTPLALTFSNHPSTLLGQRPSFSTLLTLSHKLKLLAEEHLAGVLLLPFSASIATLSAEDFLRLLKGVLDFQVLVLGHDAHIGYRREGTPERIQEISQKLNFKAKYIEPTLEEGQPISSSRIREALIKGDFARVNLLLGRNYSLFLPVQEGQKLGRFIGIPTANFSLENLLHPPLGVYIVEVNFRGRLYPAVANLGYAPTLQNSSTPRLEVHLLDQNLSLYDCEVEVLFKKFLRSEKKFDSLETLKREIQKDITHTRSYFENKTL